jgi:hypothetical protein
MQVYRFLELQNNIFSVATKVTSNNEYSLS